MPKNRPCKFFIQSAYCAFLGVRAKWNINLFFFISSNYCTLGSVSAEVQYVTPLHWRRPDSAVLTYPHFLHRLELQQVQERELTQQQRDWHPGSLEPKKTRQALLRSLEPSLPSENIGVEQGRAAGDAASQCRDCGRELPLPPWLARQCWQAACTGEAGPGGGSSTWRMYVSRWRRISSYRYTTR